MSATYNNQIEIVLFTNTKKKSDKSPSKTGTVTFPDGTKYEVAIWNKVSKNGNPFEAGTLKLPNPQYANNGGGGGNYGGQRQQNDGFGQPADIPF